jgi:ABC-type branched-subunit amino acid transport system substrate-binding protein
VSACKKLVQVDHVMLLIGGGGTDQIVACAQYAASVGVPYLAEGVTEQGLNKLPSYFALSMTYKTQGALLALYIKNVLHKTKVAMIRGNTANFEDAHTGFIAAAQGAGLQIVKDISINKDATASEASNAAQQVCTAVAPGTTPDLVVYPLMSPKIFIQMANAAATQQCFPRYAGVGITLGLNVVLQTTCGSGAMKTGASFFSPYQGLDATDPDYVPAYKKQNGGTADADDIGYALWGADKLIYAMLKAAGRDLSRQSFVKAISGQKFATGVYPATDYSKGPFGGTGVHVLLANCGKTKYDTQFQNKSSF